MSLLKGLLELSAASFVQSWLGGLGREDRATPAVYSRAGETRAPPGGLAMLNVHRLLLPALAAVLLTGASAASADTLEGQPDVTELKKKGFGDVKKDDKSEKGSRAADEEEGSKSKKGVRKKRVEDAKKDDEAKKDESDSDTDSAGASGNDKKKAANDEKPKKKKGFGKKKKTKKSKRVARKKGSTVKRKKRVRRRRVQKKK